VKLLIAYIQPDKLNTVKQALYKKEINRFSVMDVFGHSDEDGVHETYRGIEIQKDLLKKIKIEIALNDDFIDTAINIIMEACSSGEAGDGKIFITPIERAISISTKQEGPSSIG